MTAPLSIELKYRDMLFTGKCFMPKIDKIKKVYGEKTYAAIEHMFEAMWFHYLKNGHDGTVSLPYWAERIGNPKAMNIALNLLSKSGWITSVSLPENNWGSAKINENKLLQFVTMDELNSIRKQFKFSKYMLKLEDEATESKRTKLNGKVLNTGLERKGFMKTGNTKFRFDVDKMAEYKDEVIHLVNKGIEKMMLKHSSISNDLANYSEVGKEIVHHYIYSDGTYSSGQNTNDSRGRNIANYLNKVGNPVGFKIMRALLVIPEPVRNTATARGLRNKYLFIAELLGYKKGNVAGKVNFGRKAYFNKTLLPLILPKDIDKLYENVWLERIYDDIDYVLNTGSWKKKAALANYNARNITMTELAKKMETFEYKRKWSTSIEIDVSASIIAIEGLLLNHKPFMERTNMIGNTIGDAWYNEQVSDRNKFKAFIMRRSYGSGMEAGPMWTDMDLKYTQDDVNEVNHELEHGEFAVANKFKDFIIKHVKPQEQMTIKIDDEEFSIECNKHFNVGETTNKFDFYDTHSNSIKRIHNTKTVKKPDLHSFRRFFVTCIVHNLDSQTMDNSASEVYDAYEWVIDIHDALVLCCEATDYAKDVYCQGNNPEQPSLKRIYTNRKPILGKYFKSIGINATAMPTWETEVDSHIIKYDKPFNCNRIVLK